MSTSSSTTRRCSCRPPRTRASACRRWRRWRPAAPSSAPTPTATATSASTARTASCPSRRRRRPRRDRAPAHRPRAARPPRRGRPRDRPGLRLGEAHRRARGVLRAPGGVALVELGALSAGRGHSEHERQVDEAPGAGGHRLAAGARRPRAGASVSAPGSCAPHHRGNCLICRHVGVKRRDAPMRMKCGRDRRPVRVIAELGSLSSMCRCGVARGCPALSRCSRPGQGAATRSLMG